MTIYRTNHWVDAPVVGRRRRRRRVVGNWMNFREDDRAAPWEASAPSLDVVTGVPDGWAGNFTFSYYSRKGPLQSALGTDGAGRPHVRVRRADNRAAWVEFVWLGGQSTTLDATGIHQRQLVFRGFAPQTRIVYIIGRHRLDKVIRLAAPGHPESFQFAMRLAPGLTYKLVGQSIVVYDANGVEVIRTRSPAGWDSSTVAGSPDGSQAVAVALTKAGTTLQGLPAFELTPNPDDLASAVYPVFVDPTTVISGTAAIEDVLIFKGTAHTNYGGLTIRGMLSVGDAATTTLTARAFGRILNPAANIPAGTITAARLVHKRSSNTNSVNGGTVEAYTVASVFSDWVEGTALGSTQAGSCDWVDRQHNALAWSTPGGVVGTDFDSGNIGTMAYAGYPAGGLVDGTFTFSDLTPFAAWRDGTKTNGGIFFKEAVDGVGSRDYYTDESTESATPPTFEIDTVAPSVVSIPALTIPRLIR